MRDLLAEGSAWLERTRTRFATQVHTYVRADASASVSATKGKSVFDLPDSNGFQVSVESVDFLILRADLNLDDVPIEPTTGDRIVIGDLADGDVYEVMPV